jgi:hypothetical protein
MSTLDEKRLLRLRFMDEVYRNTTGDRFTFTHLDPVATSLHLSREEAGAVAQYLVDEGLIEWTALGGGLGITHAGIKEVEQALSEPSKPTQHFPPVNVIHIEHMTQSQIQQGTVGSMQQMSQTVTPSESDAVREFVKTVKQQARELELAGDAEAELEAQIATMESQMKSARPKRAILKEAGTGVLEILASAPGREAVEEVLRHVPEWLHH